MYVCQLKTCHIRPKYVEHGRQHPYCSRTCARDGHNRASSCMLEGCREEGDPAQGGFCSEQHARDAVRSKQLKACTSCRWRPRTVGMLCASCSAKTSSGPALIELSSEGRTFRRVADDFLRAWKGNDPPSVRKVVEIQLPQEIRTRHYQYRKGLESTSAIREVPTYHSSQCICDFGVKDLCLCNWDSCGICKIINSSFSELAFGDTYDNGSLGRGIYSSRSSASADQFATSSTTSPYRAMLACTADVDGDRVFVKNADAIVLKYVILYSKRTDQRS
ncbi:uncharacterized protein LAESUDRAFT_739112 [Laetiporus sulphureus 93-53]|uniref:PARP catalytic domain-containing protein n=1 Tax=Laetiporus sulphureus 93-53 TaxID=1314785 RepID=A0A165BRU7_9APHY|nr:uncharacterized protein LAESUDRAFT_739112 [Laetiporus sulphureus 93-53]KZT01539.1 hypothetical protein LAESUDRAFT_739112 [Laetiporus sulphureus 93-53]